MKKDINSRIKKLEDENKILMDSMRELCETLQTFIAEYRRSRK